VSELRTNYSEPGIAYFGNIPTMLIKSARKKLVTWWGPWLTYWTLKLLGKTMRFKEINPEIPKTYWGKRNPIIMAFWHGRLLMMPMVYKGTKASFLVSPHRDGQVIGKALERFGFHPILGSTTRRGASGFKKMVKDQKNGSDIAITPDGPKGPRYQVQIGVIELAKLTGRAVLPLTFSASKKKVFKTWDHFLLPYPFSKGVFIWGEPIYVDQNGNHAHLEEKRHLLEKRLNELTDIADHYFDLPPHSLSPEGKGAK
jgi:lysophospholipid acyltransferase (LPLAT)-like uncharacterized protein